MVKMAYFLECDNQNDQIFRIYGKNGPILECDGQNGLIFIAQWSKWSIFHNVTVKMA